MCWGVSIWFFNKDGDFHILTSFNCCISTPILRTWNGNPFESQLLTRWDYSRSDQQPRLSLELEATPIGPHIKVVSSCVLSSHVKNLAQWAIWHLCGHSSHAFLVGSVRESSLPGSKCESQRLRFQVLDSDYRCKSHDSPKWQFTYTWTLPCRHEHYTLISGAYHPKDNQQLLLCTKNSYIAFHCCVLKVTLWQNHHQNRIAIRRSVRMVLPITSPSQGHWEQHH